MPEPQLVSSNISSGRGAPVKRAISSASCCASRGAAIPCVRREALGLQPLLEDRPVPGIVDAAVELVPVVLQALVHLVAEHLIGFQHARGERSVLEQLPAARCATEAMPIVSAAILQQRHAVDAVQRHRVAEVEHSPATTASLHRRAGDYRRTRGPSGRRVSRGLTECRGSGTSDRPGGPIAPHRHRHCRPSGRRSADRP
jgi:hypothetical protein